MNVVPLHAKTRTREQWAEVINADWRKSIESIVQTGRHLIESKNELSAGEFGKMIASDLDFSQTTAMSLIKIARHPVIAENQAPDFLPVSWAVLYELSHLQPEDFEDAASKGLITPQTSMRAGRAIKQAYDRGDETPVRGSKTLSHLPSPKEAREIARATNRLVTASDGNMYSGATEEQGKAYEESRNRYYKVIDSTNALADCPVDAFEIVETAKSHWAHDFEIGAIDHAIEFLETFREALKAKRGVVDAQ